MPFITRDGVRLYWRSNGKADNPALLLLNSIGTDMGMWDEAVAYLQTTHHVIRLDARGHGASDVPPGDYTIDMLAKDALAVLEAARVDQAHVCGLSMGGMIALHLGLMAPGRVRKIVVANSSAEMPAEPWIQRAQLVRRDGMSAVAGLVEGRFFSEEFRAGSSPALANAMTTLLSLDKQGYAASCMAISGLDIFSDLPKLRAPLLVLNGQGDGATPGPQHGDRIANAVPNSQTATLPSGHMSAIELPRDFAEIVTGFLAE